MAAPGAERPDILSLTAEMPSRTLAPGEELVGEGDGGRAIAVLVEGSLSVELGESTISEIAVPGAFVGEIGALLGTARTATVRANSGATVRVIGDPEAFFATHPELGLELARQLAGRLHRLLAYLGDLRQQYAGSDDHLDLVESALGRLASRPPVEIDGGSERAPDY